MASSQKKVRGRRREAQRRVTAQKEEQRNLLNKSADLAEEVKALYVKCIDSDIVVERELLSLMATTEALVDQLCQLGLIDRTTLNVNRFQYLIKYLTGLIEKHEQNPEVTV